MSDSTELLIAITLLIIGLGLLIACHPRRGKTAWFVGKPILESGVSVLLVATVAIGLMMLVAYFTTLDDATLAGAAKR